MIHVVDSLFPEHLLKHFRTTINRGTAPFVSGYDSKEGEGYLNGKKNMSIKQCAGEY